MRNGEAKRTYIYDPWTSTKGGRVLDGGVCKEEENKGEKKKGTTVIA